jgi:hypothetical protein
MPTYDSLDGLGKEGQVCVEYANYEKQDGDLGDPEELKLLNATCYLVSWKQCKTVFGIVQE